MNWPKHQSICKFLLAASLLELGACGVKGDPQPPVPPVEIGRGRPTYRRATKQIQLGKDGVTDEERN